MNVSFLAGLRPEPKGFQRIPNTLRIICKKGGVEKDIHDNEYCDRSQYPDLQAGGPTDSFYKVAKLSFASPNLTPLLFSGCTVEPDRSVPESEINSRQPEREQQDNR